MSPPYSSPIVYDVVFRVEVEAIDEDAALEQLIDQIKWKEFKNMHPQFEILRNDNLFGQKDVASMDNGFVILTSKEKHALLDELARALGAAAKGDSGPGTVLVKRLEKRFDYGHWR